MEDCVKKSIPRKKNGEFYKHMGIDVVVAPGTKVYPVADGIVKYISRNDPDWGKRYCC